jgi:DNA primase catalytic core
VALCPFHQEKSPSFSINEEEGYYKCFGCGKSGDCYNFLTDKKGYSFLEALQFLSTKTGIELPPLTTRQKNSTPNDSARLFRTYLRKIARTTEELYHSNLLDSKNSSALDYLRSRGVTSDSIAKFRLGYAENTIDFLQKNLKKELLSEIPDIEVLATRLGVIRKGERGSSDLFRQRIIFPIHRSDGAAIAFGGRIFHQVENAPKYINTPESPIYYKRRVLYGLYQGLETIRRTREVYVVEGYMDVIGMNQAGVLNVVATCGTSLTEEHAHLLKRLVDRVVVLFDGDFAGVKAAANCFERFINTGLTVDVATIPEGEDPDSLARTGGRELIEKIIKETRKPIFSSYLDYQLKQFGEVASPASKGNVAARVASLVSTIRNPVERELLCRNAAEVLEVSFETMTSFFNVEGSSANKKKSFYSEEGQIEKKEGDEEPQARDPNQAEALYQNEIASQLLVAVLCEPQLAKAVMEMPSLITASGFHQEFPENIQAFLQEISQGEFLGVGIAKSLGVEHPEVRSEKKRFLELMQRCNLPAENIFAQALDQVMVGGSKPESVISQSSLATARSALKIEVIKLKSEEAITEDPELKLKLAQEKLSYRKKLAQYNPI